MTKVSVTAFVDKASGDILGWFPHGGKLFQAARDAVRGDDSVIRREMTVHVATSITLDDSETMASVRVNTDKLKEPENSTRDDEKLPKMSKRELGTVDDPDADDDGVDRANPVAVSDPSKSVDNRVVPEDEITEVKDLDTPAHRLKKVMEEKKAHQEPVSKKK